MPIRNFVYICNFNNKDNVWKLKISYSEQPVHNIENKKRLQYRSGRLLSKKYLHNHLQTSQLALLKLLHIYSRKIYISGWTVLIKKLACLYFGYKI